MINNFEKFTSNNRHDGKNGFFMFLEVIDDMKMNFIKSSNYLNIGNYLYFFTTEYIKDRDKLFDIIENLSSIEVLFNTYKNIKDKRLSFFIGIKDNILEYGFQDDMSRNIYKTGYFKVNSNFLKTLNSFKCLSLIDGILKITNLNNLNLLHEIKKSLLYWYKDDGQPFVLNNLIVKKSVDKSIIKNLEPNELLYKYERWCEKFKWFNKVYYYIDNDDDDKITFYVKIK